MQSTHWLILILAAVFACFCREASASPASPVDSVPFQRIYLYDGNESAARQGPFFFSENGAHDPRAELTAAIAAFRGEGKWGQMQLPAACAFPARKRVIENLTGEKFPSPECPSLQAWLDGIDADHASILFAGAYAKNPASLFGHTILRFYKEGPRSALLSYAVGFLARTDPRDNHAAYVVKGFFGGYPGFYNVEPFYMKLGLYNNSESRDLWERELALTPSEVRLLLLHLWELAFNAEIPYYFASENCSYRLLSLLEAVRPDVKLVAPGITLPYETVRSLGDAGLLRGETSFYASIGRKEVLRVRSMNKTQLRSYRKALASTDVTAGLSDPLVLDAMIDHWTHENYQAQTLLSSNERSLMETTFSRRAQIEGSAPLPADAEIASSLRLNPPSDGHRPHWLGVRAGAGDTRTLGLSYRMGAHALWQRGVGFEGFAAMEYLGFDLDYDLHARVLTDWTARIADVRSLEDFSWDFPNPSWKVTVDFKGRCALCGDASLSNFVSATGGVGLSKHLLGRRLSVFALPDVEAVASPLTSALLPGLDVGMKYDFGATRLLGTWRGQWAAARSASIWTALLAHDLNDETSVLASLRDSNLEGTEARVSLERQF